MTHFFCPREPQLKVVVASLSAVGEGFVWLKGMKRGWSRLISSYSQTAASMIGWLPMLRETRERDFVGSLVGAKLDGVVQLKQNGLLLWMKMKKWW